jgi:HK97 family phage major capsid protein
VFAGTGSLGQPLGLLSDTSITSASGTSFNLASAVGIQKTVADNVVSDSPARWAGATDVRQALQQRVAFASTASPLWADDRINGRPALVSNRMPAGGLLYGDFTEARALLWGAGVEIAADPYTQFIAGVTTYRMLLTCDVLVPRPGALVRVVTVT